MYISKPNFIYVRYSTSKRTAIAHHTLLVSKAISEFQKGEKIIIKGWKMTASLFSLVRQFHFSPFSFFYFIFISLSTSLFGESWEVLFFSFGYLAALFAHTSEGQKV